MSFFKFPYTSFQQINLDWIMKTLNQLKDAIPLVQQASTVYNQALDALDAANEAVETVTDQAAAAVSTANAAQAVAGQANTTAAQANQRAAYAESDASAAATNASAALSAAQGAASAASAAQSTADAAAAATEWTLKGTIMHNTPIETSIITIPVASIPHSLLLVFSSDNSLATDNRSVEIPRAFLMEENQPNGTAPFTAAGLSIAVGDTYVWYINLICDGNTATVRYVSTTMGNTKLYCRVYSR